MPDHTTHDLATADLRAEVQRLREENARLRDPDSPAQVATLATCVEWLVRHLRASGTPYLHLHGTNAPDPAPVYAVAVAVGRAAAPFLDAARAFGARLDRDGDPLDLVARLDRSAGLATDARGRLESEAAREVERLRTENARLLRLIDAEPCEEICERMDAEAHAFLDEVGKGHQKPACFFGDGPADVIKEARRLRAHYEALLSACVLHALSDEWFVAPFGWSSGPFAGLNPRGFVSEAEARAALEGAVGELAGDSKTETSDA